MKRIGLLLAALTFSFSLAACSQEPEPGAHSLEVTATAYTTRPEETKNYAPGITAWGDTLKPGMKAIAVSRDLIKKGLTHLTKVTIDGLPGTYVVRDKMNKRWEKKIDIYMGTDVKKAHHFGKRKVTIHWTVPPQHKK